MTLHTSFRVQRILKLLGYDLAHTRIYQRINASSFEDSVSSASWGCGQGFGDKQGLLQMQVIANLNLNLTHISNS